MDRPAHAGVPINGPKLRELRQLRGESMAALASTCGITRQYLCQIERGSRPRVSPQVYARICTALNLSDLDDRRTLLKVAA